MSEGNPSQYLYLHSCHVVLTSKSRDKTHDTDSSRDFEFRSLVNNGSVEDQRSTNGFIYLFVNNNSLQSIIIFND